MKVKILCDDDQIRITASDSKEYGTLGRVATASIEVKNEYAQELIKEAVEIIHESIGSMLRQKVEVAAMRCHLLAIEKGEE